MTKMNIKSAFRTAGLVPLNHRKVLIQMPKFNEVDIDSDMKINDASTSVETHSFAEIPFISSRINPALLNRVNTILITNIEEEIFDTSTRKFILKLIAVVEYNSAQVIISNHQIEAKDRILTKR